jgi:hypothetical protein
MEQMLGLQVEKHLLDAVEIPWLRMALVELAKLAVAVAVAVAAYRLELRQMVVQEDQEL